MDNYSKTNERRFDIAVMLRSILRHRFMVFMIACLVAMGTFVFANSTYTPVYRTRSTLVITDSRASSNVMTNLSTTKQLATVISTVFDSQELQERVYTEMGYTKMPGRINSELIPETNFFTFSVDASSPHLSYMLFNKVNEVYPSFTKSIIANAIITVYETPTVPERPINSNDSLFKAVIAFFAAAAVCCFVLALYSNFNDKIKNKDDLRSRLSIPLAIEIPAERIGRANKRRGLSIMDTSRSTRFAEAYRDLRTSIETERFKNDVKTVVITSSVKGEGKTSVAANLAISLAQIGRHVLLLDCDFANPSVSLFFGVEIPENAQLSAYLSEEDGSNKIIRKFRELPLYIAANRFASPNSYELTTSNNMKEFLSQVKQRYDYVIIDAPALADKTDAYELSDLADAFLLVVRQNFVTSSVVKNSLHILEAGSARFIGCALNFSETAAKRGYGKAAQTSAEPDRRATYANK